MTPHIRTFPVKVDSAWPDFIAKFLVVLCVLNLNGVGSMMFGIGEMVSLLMLGAAILLVISSGRYAWSLSFTLLMLAIASYLLFGTIFYDTQASPEPASKYYRAYGGSVLILLGLAGYVTSLAKSWKLARFLEFVRNTFLLAAASVWASPVLYGLYVNLPFSARQRMGGFFGNPNEAAMVSVLAVALTLALPFRWRFFQIIAVVMAGTAVLLTFSKTGMVCLVVVLGWYLVRSTKGYWRVLILVSALTALVAIQNPERLIEVVADNPVLDLDSSQKGRILAAGQILGGQINEWTTTNRTVIWEIVVDRAWEDFPLGRGLGSAHHVVGGIAELGVWQGAHNTFLMMWSEGGVLPALLLVAAMTAMISRSLGYARGGIALIGMFILLIDMTATHGALATRYHNVMLAVVLGLIAGAPKRSSRRVREGAAGGSFVSSRSAHVHTKIALNRFESR